MKSRELPQPLRGIRIRAWLYCPEDSFRGLRPVVVLCHGIPGGKPDPNDRGYLAMVEELTAEGYCCVLFNFRGCGPSGGSIDMEGWSEDLCSVVSRVHNTPGIDPSSIHCVAFSAGGAVAARHAAMEKHLQSLLLMATPENFADILPSDAEALREHFLRIGLIRDEGFPPDLEKWYKGFLDLRPGMHLPFVSPRPVCIVHGDKDETVPPEHAERLHAAACHPKRIIMLPQAGHQLRKDPRAMPIIRDWLREVR